MALLPSLVRRISRKTQINAIVLQGLATWVLPCAVLVVLSEDCYGLWWRFLPECYESHGWVCTPITANRCFPTARFDIPDLHYSFNGTNWLQELLITREELHICEARWTKPERCTTRLLEVVGTFLFMKLLTASVLPLFFLAACMIGKSRTGRRRCCLPMPFGVVMRDESGCEELDLVLWLPCRHRDRLTLMCLSEKFSPTRVMQRVAIWVDVSFGWGLLHPPTALAGLLYITVEQWTYRKTVEVLKLQFRREDRGDKRVTLPKSMMVFWLQMTGLLAALHVGSTASAAPNGQVLAMPILPMVLVGLLCSYFSLGRGVTQGAAGHEAEMEQGRGEFPLSSLLLYFSLRRGLAHGVEAGETETERTQGSIEMTSVTNTNTTSTTSLDGD
eukprot:TRINITY_DN22459_c0_g1_i2.p1 TRINITY_DN22459_c0_g1~~TRINITY_DN22459_c0_g1_i2.p1  ORF type:complete len:388 (-),score=28.93 TRINITY_DN22459_c0_g1_i2:82-1245(-)